MMTYVPVPDSDRKGNGRTPLPIPDALVRQLQHSEATGAKCVIDDLDGVTEQEIADLRRALIRAGYRLFPGKTIFKKFTAGEIRYWVGPKPAAKRGTE